MNADTTSLTVQVMLEEYRTLRTEIQHSIRLQHSTFGVGVPVLSIGLALSQMRGGDALFQLIPLALPLLAYVVLGLWLIEMSRMMRAGNYLRLLEDRLNRELVGQGALTTLDGVGLIWENWLRSQTSLSTFNPQTVHLWIQRMVVFLILVIAGSAIATLAIGQYDFPINKWIFVVAYVAFALVFMAFSMPVVVWTRKGPTAYILGDAQVPNEFKNWLGRYRDSL